MGIETIGQHLRPTGGNKTVAASGTAVALVADSTPCYSLYVRASIFNVKGIYLGDSTVDKTTSPQIVLAAGDAVTIAPPHGNRIYVNDFFIDADVNGEGVDFVYLR